MTGPVVHGPWGSTPVAQPTPQPGEWWRRAEDGALWVWLRHDGPAAQWRPTPVAMAELDEPLPDSPPNPSRITAALDLCALDGPEVDEALGVHNALDTTVDAWEAGTEIPTHAEIRRLATLTGRLPAWFYGDDLPRVEHGFLCERRGRGCQQIGGTP